MELVFWVSFNHLMMLFDIFLQSHTHTHRTVSFGIQDSFVSPQDRSSILLIVISLHGVDRTIKSKIDRFSYCIKIISISGF